MKINFSTLAKTALVLVYIVILAGGLVRMTGSGMGCPDWPKCFGHYIPPTEIEQLTWATGKPFEKGEVIIKDGMLLVAARDFTTGAQFKPNNWHAYTKHNYAVFNAFHTWLEYINRLAGAVAGLAVLAMAIVSLRLPKHKLRIKLYSFLSVFLMGFQAWLGATVVYSVLNPYKITLHMIVALVIVGILIYIIRASTDKDLKCKVSNKFAYILTVCMGLTIIQIVLGTQVRQFVDGQVKVGGQVMLEFALDNSPVSFYIHRSFSIVVLLANGFLFYLAIRFYKNLKQMAYIMALIIVEIISGIVMYYFKFPIASQPFHLLIATLLFAFQLDLIICISKFKKPKFLL